MGVTVNVNMRSVIHKGSGGICTFPIGDTCMTPGVSAGAPGPLPYPNIAQSSKTEGTKKVKCDGNVVLVKGGSFTKSNGDEAGSASPKGLVSLCNTGKAKPILYSMDVKFEGKNVVRLGDSLTLNNGSASPNCPPMPEIQAPVVGVVVGESGDPNPIVSIEIGR